LLRPSPSPCCSARSGEDVRASPSAVVPARPVSRCPGRSLTAQLSARRRRALCPPKPPPRSSLPTDCRWNTSALHPSSAQHAGKLGNTTVA
jgi:hypothetical protein